MASSVMCVGWPLYRGVLLPAHRCESPRPRSPSDLAFCGGIQAFEQLAVEREEKNRNFCCKAYTKTSINTSVKEYTLPTWAEFEIGKFTVFWKTSNGKPPTSGESLTIFFNSSASSLLPHPDFGIAFNGGFNQPIMCGGQPRVMTRRDRGINCNPLYTIRINVPSHALTLEFSFTNGKKWDGPYKLSFEMKSKWKNMPLTFFNKGLAEELSRDGACESAIYPDATFVQDRCTFPASLIHESGKSCELDIVPGCTDPESPFFNPLATVDDGSCSLNPDELSEEELA